VTIIDDLTQSTHVSHALHLTTVVPDAEVILLEDVELDIELQKAGLAVAKELVLKTKPRMTSSIVGP
jgi:hypothetical protein